MLDSCGSQQTGGRVEEAATQRQHSQWHQLAPQHQVGRVDTTDDVADELWAQRWGLVRAEVPLFIPVS